METQKEIIVVKLGWYINLEKAGMSKEEIEKFFNAESTVVTLPRQVIRIPSNRMFDFDKKAYITFAGLRKDSTRHFFKHLVSFNSSKFADQTTYEKLINALNDTLKKINLHTKFAFKLNDRYDIKHTKGTTPKITFLKDNGVSIEYRYFSDKQLIGWGKVNRDYQNRTMYFPSIEGAFETLQEAGWTELDCGWIRNRSFPILSKDNMNSQYQGFLDSRMPAPLNNDDVFGVAI